MCCLFGLIDYGHRLTGKQKGHILRALALESETRGMDATGVAYNSRGRLHIYKRPLPAHKLHLMLPNDATVVMGHTRMTTQGSERKNYNNHPFLGDAGGNRFALAHNGVIWNDKRLRKNQKLPSTKIETDSYIAVQLIEKQKALTPTSLKYMAEQVEGSFTFTVLSEDNALSFVRGDSPLSLYHYPELGLYLYASTKAILDRAVGRTWLRRELPREIPMEPGDILQIDAQGKRHSSRFEYDPYDCFSWGQWPYHCSGVKHPKPQETAYVQELKSVAGAFGYSPEAVDRMLAHGFTTDEIEEFLYCGEI